MQTWQNMNKTTWWNLQLLYKSPLQTFSSSDSNTQMIFLWSLRMLLCIKMTNQLWNLNCKSLSKESNIFKEDKNFYCLKQQWQSRSRQSIQISTWKKLKMFTKIQFRNILSKNQTQNINLINSFLICCQKWTSLPFNFLMTIQALNKFSPIRKIAFSFLEWEWSLQCCL